MKKNQNLPPKPFNNMLENYNLAKSNMPPKQKSDHWDVFPEDYEKSIAQFESWKTFLRNPLSLGFNDAMMNYDNARFQEDKKYNNIDPWSRRKEHNFADIIEENPTSPDEQKKIIDKINSLFATCGPEFTINNLESEVGSPQHYRLKYKSDTLCCNAHDLSNIYYFWQISRVSDVLFQTDAPTIAEIGPGYGGVVSKIKKRYPKARIILYDLPELSAVQTYYLYNSFPESKILYLKDFLVRGNEIFNEQFDFLILPGWMIDKAPESYFDLVINVRSMMEMTIEIIDFYFKHIHRSIKNDGLLACINRYHKNNSSNEDIILKNYPFDEFWIPLISQTSLVQNHIHDLILKRQDKKSAFHIKDVLKSLPPS